MRQEVEQLLQSARGANDVWDMEAVNQLIFSKFSFEPVYCNIFIPLHFYIVFKIADLIELDVTLKCVWAFLS